MKVIKKIIDSCASCPFIRGNNPYSCGLLMNNPEKTLTTIHVLIDNKPFHDDCPLQNVTVDEVQKMNMFEFYTGRHNQ